MFRFAQPGARLVLAVVISSAAAWCAMALRTAGAACGDVMQVMHEVKLTFTQRWFAVLIFGIQLHCNTK
jgi:hypothetical protein